MYDKYIVAYMDILGFREKIKEAGDDSAKIAIMYDTLKIANDLTMLWSLSSDTELPQHIDRNVFSDTMVLSCKTVSSATLIYFFQIIAKTQMLLIKKKVLIRGAITVGGLYRDNDVVFGPALISSYDMEEKLAFWPRVIVSETTLNELGNSLDICNLMQLSRDSYGIVYVDYLKWFSFQYWMNRDEGKSSLFKTTYDLFSEHRDKLIEAAGMVESKTETSTMVKYHALASYHNEAIEKVSGFIDKKLDKNEQDEIEKSKLIDTKIVLENLFPQMYSK